MKQFYFFLLLFSINATSQTYVKVNAVTTLLTIPQIGIEASIGNHSTFQFDITASFWKSINGHPMEFYIFIPEYRYHFHEKYNGFYAGAHMGFTLYNMQKWNYWNSNTYQEGLGYLIGATIGYQKKIGNRFLLDFFLGGGYIEGFYKSFIIGTDIRVDEATDYNKSGQWLPYRGGVMVSYQLN